MLECAVGLAVREEAAAREVYAAWAHGRWKCSSCCWEEMEIRLGIRFRVKS